MENLALRQQLAVLKQSNIRPKLRPRDRVFWTWLMRLWPAWRSALLIVQPDTVVRWHRQGFRLYWRWKSKAKMPGRPRIAPEVIALIHRMCRENPTWGAPRIQSELTLLGHDMAESTVAKYMIRHRNGTYGSYFRERIKGLGMDEVPIAPRSPWQNPYCERVIGSIRRECLNHVIVLNELHLKRILRDYLEYYHHVRTHLSLNRNAPRPRNIEPPSSGDVIAIPMVGGLHHRYTRAA